MSRTPVAAVLAVLAVLAVPVVLGLAAALAAAAVVATVAPPLQLAVRGIAPKAVPRARPLATGATRIQAIVPQ